MPIMVFLARDKEVQPIIEAVYLHHYKTGVWPKRLLELDHLEIEGNLAEWYYYGGGRQLPPSLDILGPVHLQLKYVFREDGNSASPGGWYAYCEGDRIAKTFHERIPPRIGPNPSNHFFEYTPLLVIPKNWRSM